MVLLHGISGMLIQIDHQLYLESIVKKYSPTSDPDRFRINDAVEVNGTNINANDTEFWSAIFSDEFVQRLEGVSIACDGEILHLIVPYLHDLCKAPSCPCTPFNFDVSYGSKVCLKEDYPQMLSIIASLIRQNRLVTVCLPNHYEFENYFGKDPEKYLHHYLEITNAISVTQSLVSLRWFCGITRRGDWSEKRPWLKESTQAMLAALEKNISLTEAGFYGRTDYYGWDDIIVPLLARNKALPGMNAAVAAGKVDGEWDGSCPADLVRQLIAAKFNLHRSFFNPSGDMCFCESCHRKSGNKVLYSRGDPPSRYVLPVGWMRLGLKVHEGFAESNDIFRKWHASYHGTTASNLEPIFRGGLQLLKPGDVALGGTSIGVRSGHIPKMVHRKNLYTDSDEEFDINQVFTSPSIRYSSHPAYAQQFIVNHPHRSGVRIGMRFVFQCRQRPGSYKIGQETVGARDLKLDPHFDNKELEWYTKENAGVVLCGLCVQLRYIKSS
ncbi:unnamed protein product [Adineta ricciae]|uniref:Uncharacterized protein n=3 Tax=Adineta ricciae TaxID=249248 RepID=A0A815F2M0_ADIRI|nr:unnamed protein product [Adineta ricciae]